MSRSFGVSFVLTYNDGLLAVGVGEDLAEGVLCLHKRHLHLVDHDGRPLERLAQHHRVDGRFLRAHGFGEDHSVPDDHRTRAASKQDEIQYTRNLSLLL